MNYIILLGLLVCCIFSGCHDSEEGRAIVSGNVTDDNGVVSGATVRVQGTENKTLTDDQGRYSLSGLNAHEPVTISAWKDLYYSAKFEEVVPSASDINLKLRLYQTDDNPTYVWSPPTGENGCMQCKVAVVETWLGNAHSGAATNPRFLTMYNGNDTQGNQSPLTRYVTRRDYGTVPLPPDPDLPYFGPGYKLDFPDTSGNCAACHVPGAALDDPYGIDPNQASGANAFGVHCDYCHKVAAVYLDDATGLPYENMPGVLSSDVRRPFTDDPERPNLAFGTFDDPNVPEEDTYLPLIAESAFCAPCHFGVFWDTVVYNSFGEWLESPYNDPETGKTCQQCHMPSPTMHDGSAVTNVAPGRGGIERDPSTIHAHSQRGVTDEAFMQDAVSMDVSTSTQDGEITVQVSIANDNTGHHIPTGSPLRHLILVVEAVDDEGDTLAQTSGSILPTWCGEGDREQGYYGGSPGTVYAKILEELWTQVSPTAAYWNHTRLVSDNRIPAMEAAESEYSFEIPESGAAHIEVKLIFRRAYIELADQKGWSLPDIVIAEESVISQ